MVSDIMTMDSLKKEAVRVYRGMIAVFPHYAQRSVLDVSYLVPKFNDCYAVNNSTVCFVSDNKVYVIPYTNNVIRTLKNEGFQYKYFYVPFSNGDYPQQEHLKWNGLLEQAKKAYIDEFHKECCSYCDQHSIGSISEETLKNCFEMPIAGVKVKHLYYEDVYYPIITNCSLDCVAIEKIGTYCTNNGRVVFVYRDGRTYVTKGYKIVSELRAAGYKEKGLFVPFSNGEEIQDFSLREIWKSIVRKS